MRGAYSRGIIVVSSALKLHLVQSSNIINMSAIFSGQSQTFVVIIKKFKFSIFLCYYLVYFLYSLYTQPILNRNFKKPYGHPVWTLRTYCLNSEYIHVRFVPYNVMYVYTILTLCSVENILFLRKIYQNIFLHSLKIILYGFLNKTL